MKVVVRTIARLGAHVPPVREGNRIELDLPPGTTPAEVLRRLGLSADRSYLVKINGAVVPEARHARARLRDKDELTILPKPKVG
jgi:sulfur carrier protein ThiS